MKLIPFLTAALLLSSSAFAQLFPIPPGTIPPGGYSLPGVDPILFNVSKSKNYGTLIGFDDANLQLGMKGYGSVLVVQDQTQVLGKAKAGAKVEGMANVHGSTLLGAVGRFDFEAANATWSHNGTFAIVTSQTDYAKATALVTIGPFVAFDETRNSTGDVTSLPKFNASKTHDLFDVTLTHQIAPFVDIKVFIDADAGVNLNFTGTLDPLVVSGGHIGSKAKMIGAANGWVTAHAGFSVGNFCVNAGIQIDMRLADSGFLGGVTAEAGGVTGAITLTEKPLSLLVKAFWSGICVPNGSKTWWSWAGPIYSVDYTL